MARLIYVMDPMCSWCWGFAPVLQGLAEQAAEHGVPLVLRVGGLRREQVAMDEAGRSRTLSYWQAVHAATGQSFDFDTGLPAGLIYDTEPACRALVAARGLDESRVWPLSLLIQQAFYQQGRDVTQAALLVELAEAAGLKAVPTGIAHGTVTLVADGRGFEVTTFRRDVETDGRRAVVAFSDRIEEDAARRDFTMNALYATRTGEVLDPVGGLPDLAARRLRFVGDPAQRIAEDYLRILRFYRFLACYGREADARALAACRELRAGLSGISRERIGHEMRKLLSAADPAPAVALMAEAGLAALVWCIVMAARAKARALPEDRMRAVMRRVVAVNMAALGASVFGLMFVVLGIMLGR